MVKVEDGAIVSSDVLGATTPVNPPLLSITFPLVVVKLVTTA
jgi:hypothetical protein